MSIEPKLHMHAPPCYYIGQVRRRGARKWRTVTGKVKSPKSAAIRAIQAMGDEDKRMRVLMIATCGYYGPAIVMEASR